MKFDNQIGEKLSESKPNDEQGPYFGRGLFLGETYSNKLS